MDLALIRMLYDYNYAAHHKVWDCVTELTAEQFTRNLNYSWGSVRGQVVHVMSAEWVWFSRLQGTSPAAMLAEKDFHTRDQIHAKWNEIQTFALSYIDNLTADELGGEFSYQDTKGQAHTNFVSHILLHVINHSTDHRAQILAMIHQLGGRTVEQDLILYLRQRGF